MHLLNKSLSSALAAIEIYNKPKFEYREESFSVLMSTAWELLLKAKFVQDNGGDETSIYEMMPEVEGRPATPKTNRSGNPITFGLTYLADNFRQNPESGMTPECHANLLLLIECRDNSVHFINKDLHFSLRVQEIGTAAVRNYVALAIKWFGVDFTQYNFYLMPLAFHHGFNYYTAIAIDQYNQQTKNFLSYISTTEKQFEGTEDSPHSATTMIVSRVVKTKDADAIGFKITTDPTAPEVRLTEDDLLARYPYDYRSLTTQLKRRYRNFVANNDYHRLRRAIENDNRFCHLRLLNPRSPRGGSKKYFSNAILEYFDNHYQRN